MIRRNSPRDRSGSILIVVIGLLALFAVVGLSFVLYADAEASAARSARTARNGDALPNPESTANDFLKQLIFDTNLDPNNPSAIYNNSLLMSRFAPGSNVPYTGTGVPTTLPITVNYTFGAPASAVRAVPWTYPDLNSFYLSWIDPTTGKVTVPSFHRQDVFGSLDPSNTNWMDATAKTKTLRPIPALHPNFPRVPANPDGSYTGDVANFKFMSGAAQANDSLWMYTGAPVQSWRGRQYVAMVAPLVIDLSGRLNLSVVGNNRFGPGTSHGSMHGWGQWEINPTVGSIMTQTDLNALIFARTSTGTVPGDPISGSTLGLINRGRNSPNPTTEYRVPAFYAPLDVDGIGSGGATPEYPTLPAAASTIPFPTFPSRFETSATMSTALKNHPSMFNPFQWPRGSNATTARGFGMDDLVKLGSRYSDGKTPPRYQASDIYKAIPQTGTPPSNSLDYASTRMLTTAFSVSQRWGSVQVMGQSNTPYQLGPIDLNRPLPEFRKNANMAYSPLNLWNPSSGNPTTVGTEAYNYQKAMTARQNLARDIFVRLVALVPGLIDGTTIYYLPSTGGLFFPAAPAKAATFKQLAQLAVNMVDYIDGDDIMTPFFWNTSAVDVKDPLNYVFGTELPRLVINEAYTAMFNNKLDLPAPAKDPKTMKTPATKSVQKKFWIELHNPYVKAQPADNQLSDAGAARLQYVPGVTKVADPTSATGALTAVPTLIAPYELDVFEATAAGGNSYTTFLQTDQANYVKDVTAAAAVPGMTLKLKVNQFNQDPGTPNPTLTGDAVNLVLPANGGPGVAGSNQGYYVIGPVADPNIPIPTAGFNNSLSLADPVGGTQNAMQFDIGGFAQTDIDANAPSANPPKTYVVILRRLANPYLVPQPTPGSANYNPYIAVDFMENLPTRNRVEYNEVDKIANFMQDNGASLGRRHPYAAAPAYAQGNANAAFVLQTGGATPPQTFFAQNSIIDNASGFAWLTHLDRELVNATELLPVSIVSPTMLTQKFYNGAGSNLTSYNYHNRITQSLQIYGALLDSAYPAAGQGANMYKVFDLLAVGSRLPQIPLGGREPGLVNMNMVNDARVVQALLDPQSGNTFNSTYVTDPTTGVSTKLLTSRTVSGVGGVPAALTDKPYQPYTSAATGSTIESTLLRSSTSAPGTPALFNTKPTNAVAPAQPHAYFVPEPMRKIMNNTTTVTDGYLVIWTVGFFEVDPTGTAPGTTPFQIGKELYERIPGDLRAQYAAVVDRSMATLDPTWVNPGDKPGPKPWETKLTEDTLPSTSTDPLNKTITLEGVLSGGSFSVYCDGVLTPAPVGTQLWLGLGKAPTTGDGEQVTVVSAAQAKDPSGSVIPGQVTVTLAAPPNLFHGAGTRVSNVLLGNPGPQATFDCTAPANRHLVPYYIRMQP
jgi:hypothetical protein